MAQQALADIADDAPAALTANEAQRLAARGRRTPAPVKEPVPARAGSPGGIVEQAVRDELAARRGEIEATQQQGDDATRRAHQCPRSVSPHAIASSSTARSRAASRGSRTIVLSPMRMPICRSAARTATHVKHAV